MGLPRRLWGMWRRRWGGGSTQSSRWTGLCFLLFFHFHQAILVITQRVLLNHSARFFSWQQLVDSLVTAAFGVLLFALLDRLRRRSKRTTASLAAPSPSPA